jgi:4-hydroxybenzoyl-CoA reductase subunit alpha
MDFVQVETADTKTTPVDLGSYSSRVTFMAGNAAKVAAEKIRNELACAIANEKGVPVDDICFSNGKIFTDDGTLGHIMGRWRRNCHGWPGFVR